MANNKFYMTTVIGGHSGVGQYPLDDTLNHGESSDIQPYEEAKNLYSSIEVHDKTLIAMSKVPKGAIADFAKRYLKQQEKAIANEMERTWCGNSTGAIARADGTGSSSTALTVQGWDTDSSDIHGAEYIEVGDYIKIGSNSPNLVSAVSGTSVTLTTAQTWSDEDDIVKATSTTAMDEMNGLGGLVLATGTIHNIAIAGYRNWQSSVDATSHSFASDGDSPMNLAHIPTWKYREGNAPLVLMNKTNFNAYGKTLTALKKTARTSEFIFGGQKYKQLDGYNHLDWQGGVAMYNPHIPTSRVYMIDPLTFSIGDMGGGVKFASEMGSSVWQRVADKTPRYQSVLRFYGNLLTLSPAANAVCTNYGA